MKHFVKYMPVLFAVLFYCAVTQVLFHKICPIALITGFPCPGCGITRAFFLLVTGHPRLALSMNPCLYLWILCALLLAYQCFDKDKHRFNITQWRKNNSHCNRILIATGALSVLIYVVKMCIYYPDTVPYVYYDNCLISHLKLAASFFRFI